MLGSVRAGITEIILPADNEADLEDIPDDVLRSLTVHLVENLDEVMAVALKGNAPKVKRSPKRQRTRSNAPEDETEGVTVQA